MAFYMTGLYPSLSIYTTPFPAPASGSLEGQGKDCPSIQVMSGGLRAKKTATLMAFYSGVVAGSKSVGTDLKCCVPFFMSLLGSLLPH